MELFRFFAEESKSAEEERKRARTIFSSDQLRRMETQFMKQQYIVGAQRTMLAKELNLSETQVREN